MATVWRSSPTGPTQSKVKETDEVSGPTTLVPLIGCVPDQFSDPSAVDADALQLSVSADDQVRVTESLGDTVRALETVAEVKLSLSEMDVALNVIFGAPGAATATVTCCVALLPPGPVQMIENVVLAFKWARVTLPETA